MARPPDGGYRPTSPGDGALVGAVNWFARGAYAKANIQGSPQSGETDDSPNTPESYEAKARPFNEAIGYLNISGLVGPMVRFDDAPNSLVSQVNKTSLLLSGHKGPTSGVVPGIITMSRLTTSGGVTGTKKRQFFVWVLADETRRHAVARGHTFAG